MHVEGTDAVQACGPDDADLFMFNRSSMWKHRG